MSNRSDIVTSARAWAGTPYVHQASAKGAGCDCLGLIRGVWRDVMGAEPAAIPAYSLDWSETAREERLWAAALEHLHPVDAADLGTVLLFRMREGRVAKHLGILTQGGDAPQFIHSYSGKGVVEVPLSHAWARRVVARFDFPLSSKG